jgi:peptidyl-prolyl cis-trans isomerase D
MTMLDRMRRHKNWLKWSLFLVVVAFIALYFPDFMATNMGAGAPNSMAIARVGDEEITAGTFRAAYQRQMEAFSQAYGGSVNPQLLRQLGLEQQILRQLVDERTALAEAKRLGITVSDAEVAQRIYAIPAFQENGVFDVDLYGRVLDSQRTPVTKAEFEQNLRNALIVDKLRAALTEWVTVSDAEVETEFRRRNEKVQAELAVFSADAVRDDVSLSDEQVASYFEANREDYRIGERRAVKYVLVDIEPIRQKTVVPPADVERYYRENQQQYTTPEQVRASHILFSTENADEAEVRREAEAVLKQVRAGGDFAALARRHSDDSSAGQGGDLDYFGRGRMVKEFEDVAFSLEAGATSDLVRTPFGFHIIKVTDRRPETTQPLDQVRQQIADQIAYERAQAQASAMADQLARDAKTVEDLERLATARGLELTESGFFTREEPLAGLGPAPAITNQAFEGDAGTIQGPVRAARGFVVFATTGSEPSRLPALDEVKDRVREDATSARARELAAERAAELADAFRTNFAAAARRAGVEPKRSELVARGAAWPEVGISTALDAALFAAQDGAVVGPVTTDGAAVIARIVEREEPSAEELATARESLKQELVADRRSKFFSAYMLKARERMRIEIDQEAIRAIVGA